MRSYVLRGGRLTAGQERALRSLWGRYGLALAAVARPAAGFALLPETPPIALPITPARQKEIFGRVAPLHLEIGFGDGEALAALARENPHCDFIGVEVHLPGVGRLLLRLEAEGLGNVRVVCADGAVVLEQAFAAGALAGVHLYFPDPWHKKRHHKRRLVQADFIALLASRLRAGGGFHFASDWGEYAEEVLALVEGAGCFENRAGAGEFASLKLAGRAETKFERRGRRLGHSVWDLVVRKVG